MPVKKGGFMGHPASLVWTGLPNSPLQLKQDAIFSIASQRIEYGPDSQQVKPENIVIIGARALDEMQKQTKILTESSTLF